MKTPNQNTNIRKNNPLDTRYHILNTAYQAGQILLIMVMIMAIAITIVLTITFTARTDTQLTKLEEENQKALAAAEAGIEASLKSGSNIANLSSIGSLSSTITSGSTSLTSAASAQFVSPSLSSGEGFTFYLGSYNSVTKLISNPTSNNNVSIAYDVSASANCNNMVLDIAVVTTTGVTRYIADTGNNFSSSGTQIGSVSSSTVNGTTYRCRTSNIPVTIASNPRFLIVRYISIGGPSSTTLGLVGTSTLQASGQTVTSQATTRTGVTKKVQLFQSYPQIPAEFFFTSF